MTKKKHEKSFLKPSNQNQWQMHHFFNVLRVATLVDKGRIASCIMHTSRIVSYMISVCTHTLWPVPEETSLLFIFPPLLPPIKKTLTHTHIYLYLFYMLMRNDFDKEFVQIMDATVKQWDRSWFVHVLSSFRWKKDVFLIIYYV